MKNWAKISHFWQFLPNFCRKVPTAPKNFGISFLGSRNFLSHMCGEDSGKCFSQQLQINTLLISDKSDNSYSFNISGKCFSSTIVLKRFTDSESPDFQLSNPLYHRSLVAKEDSWTFLKAHNMLIYPAISVLIMISSIFLVIILIILIINVCRKWNLAKRQCKRDMRCSLLL